LNDSVYFVFVIFVMGYWINDSLDEDVGDHGVAISSDVLPWPLNITDHVWRQFGLGVGQILGFPK
jgi:hypothetical protein